MWYLRSLEHAEAYNTGTQKWFSIFQYSCSSIWDLKYTFSLVSIIIEDLLRIWLIKIYVTIHHKGTVKSAELLRYTSR